jgi:hypothetical protein
MESIYKVRSNKQKNRSLEFSFYQDSIAPVQMLKHGDIIYLPLIAGQKLIIEVTNNRNDYVGLSINNGFYNHILGQPVNPTHSYENSLFELNPFNKGLIRERYSNAYTKADPTPLIIHNDHYQNLLVFYCKLGQVEHISHDSQEFYITYNKIARKILTVKIIPPIV